jgi:phosphatidate cytidylyltransferase
MLRTRVITATVLLAGLLAVLFLLPPVAWKVTCALICALAAWEWGGLAGWGSRARVAYGCVLGGVCVCVVITFMLGFKPTNTGGMLILIFLCFVGVGVGVFWLLVAPLWLWRKWPLRTWSAILTGSIVLLPPVLVLMFMRPWAMLVLCAIVWVADISAYFSGRAIGDKKLAPNISPGKTWAGALGAVIGVLVYCNVVLFGLFSEIFEQSAEILSDEFGLIFLFQAGFIGLAVISIVGDLFESLLKRQAGVKDSSRLLPGHGGILDRIDSLTATVPCGFLLFAALYAIIS